MQRLAFIVFACYLASIFAAGEIKVVVRNGHKSPVGKNSSHKTKSLDHLLPMPDMLNAPQVPFLPHFVGNQGKQSKTDVNELVKRISNEIDTPDVITGQETLEAFMTSVDLIRTSSFENIKQISTKIEPRTKLWSVFRDAVSQAGTGPAFSMIKEWILNGQVEGEEAAEILTVIPNTVQHPTQQYMDAFFELATHEKVTSQPFLNTSAILSFTNTMRKVVVNKESAKNRFPVYTFGRLTSQNDLLCQKYLQYLAHKLEESVHQGDGPKIQVYIRALGNTAHEDIFNIYEPYLEGKKKISDFQRLCMVTSMDKVVLTRPRKANSVLYNIYQNLGEKTEMRVASVIQIMKMNPPASTLQRMAEFTNSDHNRQVSSVVKSSIEQASRLGTLQTQKLSQRAQSAIDLLTTKEFGMQFSKQFLASSQIDGLGYKADFSYIQGKDSVLPSSLFYNHKRNMGGLKRQNFQMALMSSSSDDLVNLLLDHLAEYPQKNNHHKRHNETKWTWENIDKMFNFDFDYAKHVEGNILFTTMGGRRFFPFDSSTIESIRDDLRKSSDDFRNGKTFNYTKFYNQHEITIGFPTLTGLPFVYTLKFPSMVDLNGQIRFKAHPDFSFGNRSEMFTPRTFNASLDIDFVYSSKLQGKAGFVFPFSKQEYVTGVDKNFQIHLPVHLDLDVDRKNEQIRGKARLLDIKNNKFFECSSKPWTSVHNISNARYQKSFLMKNEHFERTLGQKSTGVAFNLRMEGNPNMKMNRDGLMSLLYPTYEDSISNHNMTLSLNKKQTTSKSARFSFSYKAVLDQQKAGRMDEIAAKASEAIKDSETKVVDAEVGFEGGQNFTATAAMSSSQVSEKSRFMLWISHATKQGKPFKLAFKVESEMPKVNLDNYKKALQSDPTSKIKAVLDYNLKEEMTSVSVEGKMERTTKRTEFLKRHPVSQDCFKEMSRGDNLGLSCRNVTANANFLDKYRFNIKYNNVPECCRKAASSLFGLARYWAYPWSSQKLSENEKDSIEVGVRFSTNLKYVDVDVKSPAMTSKFEHVPVNQMVIPLVVSHPEYNALERLNQKLLQRQQFPVCSMDKTTIMTFDEKPVPIKSSKCWRLLAHSAQKPRFKPEGVSVNFFHPENEQISIIARETSPSQREIVLLLGKNTIEVQSTQSVKVNGEKASLKGLQMFEDENIFAKIHSMNGSLKIEGVQTGMQIIYDGYHIKLQVTNSLRNQMRGLCGNFDGEDANDMMTPKNCIVNNPSYFASSYGIDCDKPEMKTCIKETVLFSDAVKNQDTDVHAKKGEASCISHTVKIIENSGEKCFSVRPLVNCKSHCKPTKEVEKSVDFYCVSSNEVAARWVELVKKGGNPDFSQKGPNYRESIKLPESCKE